MALEVSWHHLKWEKNAAKNNVKNMDFIEDMNFLDINQQFGGFGSVVA